MYISFSIRYFYNIVVSYKYLLYRQILKGINRFCDTNLGKKIVDLGKKKRVPRRLLCEEEGEL